MTNQKKQSTEAAVREIRRRSRRKFSPEEKIRIVLEGLRGEQSVSDFCADEKASPRTSTTDGARTSSKRARSSWRATRSEKPPVTKSKDLRSENRELKEVVAEITLKNRVLKKSLTGHGEEDAS